MIRFSSEKCEDNPKGPTVARLSSLLNRRGPAAVFAASLVLLYVGLVSTFSFAAASSSSFRPSNEDRAAGGPSIDNRDGGGGGSRRLGDGELGDGGIGGGSGDGPYRITVPLHRTICPTPIRAGSRFRGAGHYLCSASTITDADVGRTSKNPNDVTNFAGRCVVYSFGMDDSLAFEKYMSSRNCEVHVFDPGLAGLQDKKKYRGLIGDSTGRVGATSFHPYGLGYEDTSYPPGMAPYRWPGVSYLTEDNKKAWDVFRLSSVMFKLRTEAITVLRVDIEGGEWDVVRDLVMADWDELILELHFPPGEYVLSKSSAGGLTVTRRRHLTFFRRNRPARNLPESMATIDRIGLLDMLTKVADLFHWERRDGQRVQACFRRHEPRQNSKLYVMDDMMPRAPSRSDEVA